MMGGELEVESTYGQGTTFFFTIWQGLYEGSENHSHKSEEMQGSIEDRIYPDAKILVVDDNTVNLFIVEEMMEPLQCQVDTAESGEEAIELVKNKKYDMIFMDYMMPEMDGIEATTIIRSLDDGEDYYKKVPIVALTGDGSDDTKEKFRLAGVNDFMEKPLEMKRIKEVLSLWI